MSSVPPIFWYSTPFQMSVAMDAPHTAVGCHQRVVFAQRMSSSLSAVMRPKEHWQLCSSAPARCRLTVLEILHHHLLHGEVILALYRPFAGLASMHPRLKVRTLIIDTWRFCPAILGCKSACFETKLFEVPHHPRTPSSAASLAGSSV
jgi:hypothetical protein